MRIERMISLEKYEPPKVLDHQKLIFETIISGGREFPPEDPPGDYEEDGGGGNGGGGGHNGGDNGGSGGNGGDGGTSNSGGGDNSNSNPSGGGGHEVTAGEPDSPSQSDLPPTSSSDHSISSAPPSTFSDEPNDKPPSKTSQSPQAMDALFTHTSNGTPQTLIEGSTYKLPNTGTMWYTWGIESIVIAGLSGLAIWAGKRGEFKKWRD